MLAHTVCTFACCFVQILNQPNVSAKCAPELAGYGIPLSKYVSSEDLKIASLTDFISFIQEAPHASLSAILLEYQISLQTDQSTGIMTI
jgi:hypothetical protein